MMSRNSGSSRARASGRRVSGEDRDRPEGDGVARVVVQAQREGSGRQANNPAAGRSFLSLQHLSHGAGRRDPCQSLSYPDLGRAAV
jgi:hypothetical protein